MGKKNSKHTQTAHIKSHTAGTSNEISLSVLDAARQRADLEHGKAESSAPFRPGKISILSWRPTSRKPKPTPSRDDALALMSDDTVGLSSGETYKARLYTDQALQYGSVGKKESTAFGGSTSAVSSAVRSPEDEIERRKKRRRRRRFLYTSLGAIFLAFALVSIGTFAYKEINRHKQMTSLLEESLTLALQADGPTVKLDELINTPLDEVSAEEIVEVLFSLEGAESSLKEAHGYAELSLEEMRESAEREAADQALTATDSRLIMIEEGRKILQAGLAYKEGTDSLSEVWSVIVKADACIREAALSVVDTSDENVEVSKSKLTEAAGYLDEALISLTALHESSLSPDMQEMIDYTKTRKEGVGHGIASDEAILARDRETAEKENGLYNEAEAESAMLAEGLSEKSSKALLDAYEEATKAPRAIYEASRLEASTADVFLRDYLGTSNK